MPEPELLQPCPICRHGCSCNVPAGESCGHYGCRGRSPEESSSCPGAVIEMGRYAAQSAAQDVRSRIFRARRMSESHVYARNVARMAGEDARAVERRIAGHRPHVEP